MKPLFLLVALCLSGCAVYKHERPVLIHMVDGQTIVAMESTSISMFLQRLSTSGLKTKVHDGTYSRDVALGKLGSTGDAEMIQAISEGVTEGIISSQTGGIGLRPTN